MSLFRCSVVNWIKHQNFGKYKMHFLLNHFLVGKSRNKLRCKRSVLLPLVQYEIVPDQNNIENNPKSILIRLLILSCSVANSQYTVEIQWLEQLSLFETRIV